MSDQIYTASVYERTVKYTNFKGETRDATLTFALDPLQLLSVIVVKDDGRPVRRFRFATEPKEGFDSACP